MAVEKIPATVTVKFVADADDAKISEKQELAVNGGGTSLFYGGSRFLIHTVPVKAAQWGSTKGKAFIVTDDEGNIVFCGFGRAKGGGGYVEKPSDKGTWTLTADKQYWVCTTEEELTWKKFGVASAGLKNWVEDGIPKGCVLVEVDKVEYLYGCEPVKASEPKPAATKAVFTKSVKAWQGRARYATEEEIAEFAAKHLERVPGDALPESWLKCMK
jgi:hypothetical protein